MAKPWAPNLEEGESVAIAERVSYRTELIDPDLELVVRLRNHLAVVKGANEMLAEQWDELDNSDRRRLLELACRGARQLDLDVSEFSTRVIDLTEPDR